ncbi:MAG: hypothetical protein RJA13_1291 [Bacteroidota bacterium]|jgi:hypothetical protein
MKLKLLSIAVSSCLTGSLFSFSAYAACSDGDFAQCRTQQECEDQKGSWANNQCSAFGQIPTSSTTQTTSSMSIQFVDAIDTKSSYGFAVDNNGQIVRTNSTLNTVLISGKTTHSTSQNKIVVSLRKESDNGAVEEQSGTNGVQTLNDFLKSFQPAAYITGDTAMLYAKIQIFDANGGFLEETRTSSFQWCRNASCSSTTSTTSNSSTSSTSTTPPPVQNTTDLTTGLVAYYCFDDPNNIGKDCSTNNNVGTPSGGVNAIANGVKGGAANFGGISNPGHIRIPNSTSLNFDRYLTASFFVKLNTEEGMDGYGNALAAGGTQNIFSKDHDSSGFYSSFASSNGNVSAWFGNNAYSQPTFSVGTDWKPYSVLQNWLHVTYVFSKDTNSAQMYFNGELVKEETGKSIDFSIANTRDLYLGKYSNYWYPLNGMLDEVRFYNRALSANEIKQLATIAEPPKFDLTVMQPSNGEVVAPNIACGSDCTESYAANTLITLLAKPSPGFIVDNWTGCNVSADKQTCEITMDAAKTVGITFKASPVQQPPITTTECDPVYNFQTESLGFYVLYPTQNALNGGLTGSFDTFKATLTHIHGFSEERFYVEDLISPNPLPEAKCQAQFAILTMDNGSLKVHLPRVAIPKITSVFGKTVYSGVELYQVTLKWNEMDGNFGISSINPLQ